MKKVVWLTIILWLLTTGYGQKFEVMGKIVKVYTTAKDTDLRLSETTKTAFKDTKQATEGEVSIFVNPDKSFQTFLGIGAALTDASAEVFAKLSKKNQREFLKAHFDVNDGIGYSLARTNIHACDFSKGLFIRREKRPFS